MGRAARRSVAAALALPLSCWTLGAFGARDGYASMRSAELAAWIPRAETEELAAAEEGQPTEYKLKAAVLYKFARYTRWPDAAFKDKTAPIVVAVIGKDPFGALLEETFRERVIGDRKVEIVRWTETAQIGACHMLFVAGKDEKLEDKVAEVVRGRAVLLVTDSLRGAERDAHIGFYLDSNKVRFAVNLKNTKACSLEISSELLKLAKIIAGAIER